MDMNFFPLWFVVKIVLFGWKRPKIKEKRQGLATFFKKTCLGRFGVQWSHPRHWIWANKRFFRFLLHPCPTPSLSKQNFRARPILTPWQNKTGTRTLARIRWRRKRKSGVFIGTLTRYSAEVVRLDGGADSRHPNRDERARLLRHISGVTGDDDDFVNDALPFKVELFGECQEAGLCVDVEVTFTIRLTTVDRIRDATVFALK